MKVYFYHTQDVQRILSEGREGRFPAHFMYGATHLADHGLEVIYHKHRPLLSRWKMAVDVTWKVLTCRERFDALYATHYQGLEVIIFMRALGLFRRPVVVWHHQPMVPPSGMFRRVFVSLFYKGIDRLFFFSEKLLRDSLASPCACEERMRVGHWGPDLDYYGRLMRNGGDVARSGFVSTGKECRDMPTLIEAFNGTGAVIDIYMPRTFRLDEYGVSKEMLCEKYGAVLKDNVRLHFVHGLIPYELSLKVNRAACVAVCCYETNYTVGLTTVVEALALGLPVICSRNPQIPIDFDKEGCGISVAYGDVEGWRRAIDYIESHPDEARAMGRAARRLAETRFNDRICAADAVAALREVVR